MYNLDFMFLIMSSNNVKNPTHCFISNDWRRFSSWRVRARERERGGGERERERGREAASEPCSSYGQVCLCMFVLLYCSPCMMPVTPASIQLLGCTRLHCECWHEPAPTSICASFIRSLSIIWWGCERVICLHFFLREREG